MGALFCWAQPAQPTDRENERHCAASHTMGSAATLGAVLLSAAQIGFNPPYVASYGLSGSLDACLTGSKAALEKHGYLVVELLPLKSGDGIVIYGRHRELALGAAMECDPVRSRGSLAVAGPNDQEAFESFQQIRREQW